MPIFPVRDIAKYGIITDQDPYTLPVGAWSSGVNVRFRNGSVTRAPVFRNVQGLTNASPRFCTANTPNAGFSSIIIGSLNGRVTSITSGVGETDISIAGYTNSNAEAPFTSTHLADVFYVNRSDRIPWSLRTSDTVFQPLANWDATWRAQLLRSCGSALVALGITKGGASFPTMVKTSEFAIADSVPSTWDAADPTTNATENILAEMDSPIVDAQTLGEVMFIYGLEETWLMQADGSENVWSYHKIFNDAGAINANCVVEVNKMHFVFGLNDIWKHDGVSKVSICDQRVRDFIFSSMNLAATNRCFVSYNAKLKEITFNYVSADALASFGTQTSGCNRAAVYNITTDTWTFDDLPFVFGSAEANLDTITPWDGATASWATIGGTWADQNDSLKRVAVMVGDDASTFDITRSLYAFDLQGPGSVVALPVDTKATMGWQLSRDGIDLDEVGVDLRGYKTINTIYPQARLQTDAVPVTFSFGSADYFSEAVTMSDPQTYDGLALYKLDYNSAGRYLLMQMSHDDWHYVNITGFDLDLDVTGER
jgi:hypothetical protein